MSNGETEKRELGAAREFFRKRTGRTQQQLADDVGVTVRTIHAAEHGEPISTIVRNSCARVLGVEPDAYEHGRVGVAASPDSAPAESR